MNRQRVTTLIGALAVAAALGAPARAQYGPGYYGWSGWGGGTTALGNISSGMGNLAAGAGQYNVNTAEARSVNAQTAMQWNQYTRQVQQANTAAYWAHRGKIKANDDKALNELQDRIANHPTDDDVRQGDAQNAILMQLTDPQLKVELGRVSPVTIDKKLIREIPFQKAAEGLTFSLEQLAKDANWPAAFRTAAFDPLIDKLQAQLAAAKAEYQQKERLSGATIDGMAGTMKQIRAKLETLPKNLQYQEADRYLKGLAGLGRMLRDPDIDAALVGLDKVETVNIANLLGFMQLYNLRFGVAKTPRQVAAYETLYPAMVDLRDEMLQGATPGPIATNAPPPPPPAEATAIFHELPAQHLEATPAPPAPAPQ